MTESRRTGRLDVPSTEKVILARKVNEICRLSPSEFRAEQHLGFVKDIVTSLDPRLIESSRIGLSFTIKGDQDESNTRLTGHTNLGNVDFQAKGEPVKHELNLGKENFVGIGEYIVKKTVSKGRSLLSFNYFMRDEEIEELLRPWVSIGYDASTLEPFEVSKHFPVQKSLLGFKLVTYKEFTLWAASGN